MKHGSSDMAFCAIVIELGFCQGGVTRLSPPQSIFHAAKTMGETIKRQTEQATRDIYKSFKLFVRLF
jgi:hypothetical protein